VSREVIDLIHGMSLVNPCAYRKLHSAFNQRNATYIQIVWLVRPQFRLLECR
jgi:hypothetical protein